MGYVPFIVSLDVLHYHTLTILGAKSVGDTACHVNKLIADRSKVKVNSSENIDSN